MGSEIDGSTGAMRKLHPDPAIAPARAREALASLSWDDLRRVREEFTRLSGALPSLLMPPESLSKKEALALVVVLIVALAFAGQNTAQSRRAAWKLWTMEVRTFLVWLALRESRLSSYINRAAKDRGYQLTDESASGGQEDEHLPAS